MRMKLDLIDEIWNREFVEVFIKASLWIDGVVIGAINRAILSAVLIAVCSCGRVQISVMISLPSLRAFSCRLQFLE